MFILSAAHFVLNPLAAWADCTGACKAIDAGLKGDCTAYLSGNEYILNTYEYGVICAAFETGTHDTSVCGLEAYRSSKVGLEKILFERNRDYLYAFETICHGVRLQKNGKFKPDGQIVTPSQAIASCIANENPLPDEMKIITKLKNEDLSSSIIKKACTGFRQYRKHSAARSSAKADSLDSTSSSAPCAGQYVTTPLDPAQHGSLRDSVNALNAVDQIENNPPAKPAPKRTAPKEPIVQTYQSTSQIHTYGSTSQASSQIYGDLSLIKPKLVAEEILTSAKEKSNSIASYLSDSIKCNQDFRSSENVPSSDAAAWAICDAHLASTKLNSTCKLDQRHANQFGSGPKEVCDFLKNPDDSQKMCNDVNEKNLENTINTVLDTRMDSNGNIGDSPIPALRFKAVFCQGYATYVAAQRKSDDPASDRSSSSRSSSSSARDPSSSGSASSSSSPGSSPPASRKNSDSEGSASNADSTRSGPARGPSGGVRVLPALPARPALKPASGVDPASSSSAPPQSATQPKLRPALPPRSSASPNEK